MIQTEGEAESGHWNWQLLALTDVSSRCKATSGSEGVASAFANCSSTDCYQGAKRESRIRLPIDATDPEQNNADWQLSKGYRRARRAAKRAADAEPP